MHSRYSLFCFAALIAQGFLDELARKLEDESGAFEVTSGKINSFLGSAEAKAASKKPSDRRS